MSNWGNVPKGESWQDSAGDQRNEIQLREPDIIITRPIGAIWLAAITDWGSYWKHDNWRKDNWKIK